jgi:hypothetical protein
MKTARILLLLLLSPIVVAAAAAAAVLTIVWAIVRHAIENESS